MFNFDGSPQQTTNRQSEVANLIALIDAESESLFQALHSFSKTASHELINARYGRLGQLGNQLGQHIGKDVAIDIIAKSVDKQ
jgi:hypothetical protein